MVSMVRNPCTERGLGLGKMVINRSMKQVLITRKNAVTKVIEIDDGLRRDVGELGTNVGLDGGAVLAIEGTTGSCVVVVDKLGTDNPLQRKDVIGLRSNRVETFTCHGRGSEKETGEAKGEFVMHGMGLDERGSR